MRVLRQPLLLRVVNALALGACAAMLAFYAITERSPAAVLAAAAAVLTAGIAVRGWLLRIEVADGEVRLVNWWRTIDVPWSEVERFGCDGTLWVRRRDMREHSSSAFAFVPGILPLTRAPAMNAAVELEELRKKRRRRGGGRDRA